MGNDHLLQFEYVAWHRDPKLPSDDQDYESCIVITVRAADAKAAQAWGDQLAKRYGATSGEQFLWSSVELSTTPMEDVYRTSEWNKLPTSDPRLWVTSDGDVDSARRLGLW